MANSAAENKKQGFMSPKLIANSGSAGKARFSEENAVFFLKKSCTLTQPVKKPWFYAWI